MPEFNAEQWAREHQARDDERHAGMDKNFTNVWRVLAFAGVTIVGILSWSLKTQYEGMATQVQSAQVQLRAIQELKAQVGVPKQAY